MNSAQKHAWITYEIKVQGELDRSWATYFDGLEVTPGDTSEQTPTTTLICPVTDQAALRGLTCKLWDMGLTLISVRRIEADDEKEESND